MRPRKGADVPRTVRIIRVVTFTEEVARDHPAVAAAIARRPVDPSLLPIALLGRDPSVITESTWFMQDGRRPVEIKLDRSR
jgi:hypothetical protein